MAKIIIFIFKQNIVKIKKFPKIQRKPGLFIIIKMICYIIFGLFSLKLLFNQQLFLTLIQVHYKGIIHQLGMSKQQNKKGRPTDSKIEIMFLTKLRGPKLQCINSETELQLLLKELQHQQNAQILVNQLTDLYKINYLSIQRKKYLIQICLTAISQWKFVDIKTIEEFPQFLFQHSTDLSYIFSFILQKQRNLQKNNLIPYQMLFVKLICLQQRQQLTFYLLDQYIDHYIQISNLISIGLEKIASTILLKEKKEEEENDVDQISHQKKRKEKKIQKISKEKKQSEYSIKQKHTSSETNIINNQLVIKTVNHIVWAYHYIHNQYP